MLLLVLSHAWAGRTAGIVTAIKILPNIGTALARRRTEGYSHAGILKVCDFVAVDATPLRETGVPGSA